MKKNRNYLSVLISPGDGLLHFSGDGRHDNKICSSVGIQKYGSYRIQVGTMMIIIIMRSVRNNHTETRVCVRRRRARDGRACATLNE